MIKYCQRNAVRKMIFERQDKVLENLKVEDAIEQLLIHTRIIQETETVDLL